MSAAGGRLHLQLDSSHQKKAGPWEDQKIWRDSSNSRSFEGNGFAFIPAKIWVGGMPGENSPLFSSSNGPKRKKGVAANAHYL